MTPQCIQKFCNKCSTKKNKLKNKKEFSVVTFESDDPSFKTLSLAKRKLKKLYKKGGYSFYCDEEFNKSHHFKKFKYFQPKKRKNKKKHIVNWTQVVSSKKLSELFPEFKLGHADCVTKKKTPFKGVNCVRKLYKKFRIMEADPINLVPVIDDLKVMRSHYPFGASSPLEPNKHCIMTLRNKKIDPPFKRKGDVARIHRYMEQKYDIELLNKKTRKLFSDWEKIDPIDKNECIRIFNHSNRREMGIFKKLCQ